MLARRNNTVQLVQGTSLHTAGGYLVTAYPVGAQVVSVNTGTNTITVRAGRVTLTNELNVKGDVGGLASSNSLTGTSNVTANSTGVGTIKFKGTTARDSAGFIKVYIGIDAYYIPVFSAITG